METNKRGPISTTDLILIFVFIIIEIFLYFGLSLAQVVGDSPRTGTYNLVFLLWSLAVATVGSLLLYGLVRLIRGAERRPAPLRFILISGIVLTLPFIAVKAALYIGIKKIATDQSSDTASSGQASPSSAIDIAKESDQKGWPFPPLVQGDWQYVNSSSARSYIDILNDTVPSEWLDKAHSISALRCTQLKFYGGVGLCEGLVDTGTARPGVFTFILFKNAAVLLDGKGDAINSLNARNPPKLEDSASAEAYLRFFTAAVFAANGNFRIVDNTDSLDWSHDATQADKDKAAKFVRPLVIEDAGDGRYKASATVQYASEIENAVFYVYKSQDAEGHYPGSVEMKEDFFLVDKLGFKRYAFDGPVRYAVALYK